MISVFMRMILVSLMFCICLLHTMSSLYRKQFAMLEYKFASYSYSILQKFTVDDKVIVTILFGMFPAGTVGKLYARGTYSYRVLRKNTFITHELDNPWDLGINTIFNGENLSLSDAWAFIDLSWTAIDLSQRPVLTPPLWFILDAWRSPPVSRSPPWPNWDALCEEIVPFNPYMLDVISAFTWDEYFQVGENDEDIFSFL